MGKSTPVGPVVRSVAGPLRTMSACPSHEMRQLKVQFARVTGCVVHKLLLPRSCTVLGAVAARGAPAMAGVGSATGLTCTRIA